MSLWLVSFPCRFQGSSSSLHAIFDAHLKSKLLEKRKVKVPPRLTSGDFFSDPGLGSSFFEGNLLCAAFFLIRVAVCCAAEALSMLISPVSVLEWIQQQAAAAWFVFFVAMFGVWCGAGYWHVLGLRIQRAACTAEMTLCARLARPSLRCGHVLGLRIGRATHGASLALDCLR